MKKICNVLLLIPLLLVIILPASAQHRNDQQFYNGVRSGGHGGNYYGRSHYDHRQYRDQGGIGPGKGAVIGAAGGAVIGALFSGSLKGTIVGGAAGAGIGAVVGQAHQDNRDNNYYRR
jgi:hypothetical protein